MVTRRKSGRRTRRRQTRRGGFLGIPFFKTDSDNISNCKKYWMDPNTWTSNQPVDCNDPRTTDRIDFPGFSKKMLGNRPADKKYGVFVPGFKESRPN